MVQNIPALIDQAEACLFHSIHLTPADVLHRIQIKYSMNYGFPLSTKKLYTQPSVSRNGLSIREGYINDIWIESV